MGRETSPFSYLLILEKIKIQKADWSEVFGWYIRAMLLFCFCQSVNIAHKGHPEPEGLETVGK